MFFDTCQLFFVCYGFHTLPCFGCLTGHLFVTAMRRASTEPLQTPGGADSSQTRQLEVLNATAILKQGSKSVMIMS